ncbi:MAG: universal stress protein [Halodesulfurarchaeum sp.]
MYRILLPVDDTIERAKKQARFVTSMPVSTDSLVVVVAHAFTGGERDVPDAMKRVDRVETVRWVTDRLEDAGVAVEHRELSTPPASGILEYVEESAVDQIVMGGRKRSPVEKAILGSVTESVVLKTDVPVTVTGSV